MTVSERLQSRLFIMYVASRKTHPDVFSTLRLEEGKEQPKVVLSIGNHSHRPVRDLRTMSCRDRNFGALPLPGCESALIVLYNLWLL